MRIAFVMVCALAGLAHAQKLEHVASVTVASSPHEARVVGTDHVALTPLLCDGDDCFVDVAELTSRQPIRTHASRAVLEHQFGHASGAYRTLEGVLVSYSASRAGFLFTDRETPGSSEWYGELDRQTGGVVRTAKLGAWSADVDLRVIGADPGHDAVWFAVETYSGPRRPDLHYARVKSASSIAFRRLDLTTLAVADVVTVKLPARVQQAPLEDELSIHHADDFSRFVVVEYYEEPHRLTPPASAYVVDPSAATSFAIEIPEVVYAAAFSHDDRYLYLSSSVSGVVDRVDLATKAIDKTVHGPKLTHQAVVTPDGKHLLVLGSAKRYVSFELPDLGHARELEHDKRVAPAIGELGGGGVTLSADGRYFVMPQPSKAGADKSSYEIARVGN